MVQQRIGSLVGASDPFLFNRRDQIVSLAARHRIPAIYYLRDFAHAGGLMAYGNSLTDMPKGKQQHRGVAVATAVVLCGFDQPFNLPLGQMLPRPVMGIRLAANCALFVAWADQLERRNSRHFPLHHFSTMRL